MKKLFITLTLITTLMSCVEEKPVLDTSEYTIMDTTYVGKNGFGNTLYYDVILLNHYDSMYHAGSVDTDKNLIEYNARPIKLK